jgi:hypothetical protein
MTTEEWKEVSKVTNMLFVLADVQETYTKGLEKKLARQGELRHDVKHYINQIKKNTRLLVQHVNRHAEVHNDNFAHDADYLFELIDKELNK